MQTVRHSTQPVGALGVLFRFSVYSLWATSLLLLISNASAAPINVLWYGNSYSIRGGGSNGANSYGAALTFQGLYNASSLSSNNPLNLIRAVHASYSIDRELSETKPVTFDTNTGAVATGFGNFLPKGKPPVRWDVVLLQDQSETPCYSYFNYLHDAAAKKSHLPFSQWAAAHPTNLINNFWNANMTAINRALAISPTTKVILYESWARNACNPKTWPVLSSFSPATNITQAQAASQIMLDDNRLADEALVSAASDPKRVSIVRVGEAFCHFTKEYADSNAAALIYSNDGSHPNANGAYLAASLIFERITGQSVVGNSYTGSLSSSNTVLFQNIAHEFNGSPSTRH